MNKPSFLITDHSIVLVKGGKRMIAGKDHYNFNEIKNRIREGRFNNIERLFEIKDVIKKVFDIVIKNNSQVFYKGELVPSGLADKVLDCLRENVPYKPVAKFLSKLMSNPDKESRDSLFNYLSQQSLPITEDGDFIAYKSIRNDWMDHHSGAVSNKIGETPMMKREHVNKNKSECSGAGLHVGSYRYISSYYNTPGNRYIMVKVNPRDVVIVPNEANYGKIRICRYKVIQEIKLQDMDHKINFAPNVPAYKELRQRRDKNGRFAKAS